MTAVAVDLSSHVLSSARASLRSVQATLGKLEAAVECTVGKPGQLEQLASSCWPEIGGR
jgi:hypothetical protein